MALKSNNYALSNKVVDTKREPIVLVKFTENRGKSARIGLKIANMIRNTIVYILDLVLMIILLPYILYQWASKNERPMIILKVIVEILLEAIMWLIFAGVSVLVTLAFIIEELYLSRNDKNVKLSIDIPDDLDTLQSSKKKEQSHYRS